jgi:drug/metabolite transporter (DMT)-like permease
MTASAVAEGAQAIRDRAERTTVVAFLFAVGLGGLSPVLVRITLRELPPMWGGALRFGLAALILLVIVTARGIRRPTGRALLGTLLFGALGMGLSTALIYRGLVDTPAGVSQVILALVPLETFLLAVGVGLERFRWEPLLGAAIAVAGVGIVFGDQLSANVPLLGLLSILAAGVSIAATTVVIKWFPATHPLSAASVALPVGALIFVGASLLFGETHPLPSSSTVWLAFGWLLVVGTLGVMSLFLFVISRLSASVASYQFLLMPLVTVIASAIVSGEQISAPFLAGAAVVLLGVYFGIVRTARNRATAIVAAPIE